MRRHPLRQSLLGIGVAIALGGGAVACSNGTSTSGPTTQTDAARTAGEDTVVTSMVETRLAGDTTLSGHEVYVTTENGVVTLEGTVPSDHAKTTAEAIARSVDGVMRVQNDIVVGRSERMAEASRIASDTWITTKVISLLVADSISQGLDISVDTRDGVVTLSGDIEHEDDIDHVRELAADVEGVRNVDTAGLVVATRN